jgi:phage terminase large subunit-like protein
MPWQRHVVDVALEVDPETGKLVYREVDLTVPRQSGKTSLILAVMVHRALGFGKPQNIVYTAQTRNDARKKWEDDHLAILDNSPLKPLYEARFTNGNEAIKWNNGSMHGITSSTEKAGHGASLDLAVLDEAFAHEDARLEQGLSPTMITRDQPQIWIPSTAGTKKSVFLRKKVDTGRTRVEVGLTDSVAYFEWSAPADADPGSPETWWNCMPALGHTIDEKSIRAEFERLDLAEFRRAYLNQWPDDAPSEWLVIPEASWMALEDPESAREGSVAVAIDMTPDRSHVAIGVAGRRADGKSHVEVIHHERGTTGIVEKIKGLAARHKPCAVVIDGAGPAGSLIAPLEAAGIDIVKPTARETMQACGQFYDSVCDTADLRHIGQVSLNTALAGASKRPLGDGWAWTRKGLSADISPLVAVTLALWGHTTHSHLNKPRDILANIW